MFFPVSVNRFPLKGSTTPHFRRYSWETRAMAKQRVLVTGAETRSFMYVDDCVEGLLRLMASHYAEPPNLGTAD